MATTHHFNYTSADHINMLGLRDVVFIAPQSSLHPQQPQQPPPISDHHHPPSFHLPSSTALGVGVSIFPVLTATPYNVVEDCGNANNNGEASNTANFWRRCDDQSSFSKKDVLGVGEDESNRGEKLEEIGGLSNSNLRVCRDCGNRAKKECSYRRCRTCCKSRGYDCSTHVRSTWVPAARRRERQMAPVGIGFVGGGEGGAGGGSGGGGSSGSSSGVKRPKLVDGSSNHGGTNASSTSNATTPRSFDTSSCHHQDASFKQSLPGQVRAPAVFRCIRVTAISDNAAEFAYQASVSISGHVFRGFLYDQGIDEKNAFPCISERRFGGAAGTRIGDSSPIVDPPNAYAASGCRRLLEGYFMM
ncbi:protein LATERAL ROOT PRIMORDIUM 1 isoform X2 [Rhodamnia argentea]|uniref:Protein LATERAL ROOT PRIMORDIUM 1 isoform X2 n=1 Tax=Rhodamnia argentea TaxID=178133 RepID=A0A8B8PBH5_9MYRT|nr:protein LATERAL ROOT PRIMORDIUM 1 isoform X2 [Rhodamnia argentea]